MINFLNRRLLQIFIILILFSGCSNPEVSVRPSKRVQVSGTILDRNNDPIPRILVETGGSFGLLESINDSNRLGDGLSEANGNFNFISLDTRNSNFNISINSKDHPLHDSRFESVFLIDTADAHGTFLNFEDALVLRKKLQVELNLRKAEQQSDRINYRVLYEPAERRFLIDARQISNQIDNDFGSGSFNSSLSFSSPERTLLLELIEGSRIAISFSVDNGPEKDTILTPSPTQNNYLLEF